LSKISIWVRSKSNRDLMKSESMLLTNFKFHWIAILTYRSRPSNPYLILKSSSYYYKCLQWYLLGVTTKILLIPYKYKSTFKIESYTLLFVHIIVLLSLVFHWLERQSTCILPMKKNPRWTNDKLLSLCNKFQPSNKSSYFQLQDQFLIEKRIKRNGNINLLNNFCTLIRLKKN